MFLLFLALATIPACLGQFGGSCPLICTMDYTPVCGSDGKTYGNLCALEGANCTGTNKGLLQLAHKGECTPIQRRSALSAVLMDCRMMACLDVWTPVCGSDGHTYSNDCYMKTASCMSNSIITKVSNGACGGTITKRMACGAIYCMALYDPVCGNDGKTYSNTCALEEAKLCGHASLKMASRGVCDDDLLVS